MGCGGSKQDAASPAPAPVDATVAPAPAAQGGKVKKVVGKWQIKLSGEWKDFSKEEALVLTRAYLVGQPSAKYNIRGQAYEYHFKDMQQVNKQTGKPREIRAPKGMRPPEQPLLPKGDTIIYTVKEGQAGQTIEMDDPRPEHKGEKMKVNVPERAKAGSKIAVPLPAQGETFEDVRKKQKEWSTGAKVAVGATGAIAASGAVVAGVILGDHLSGGAVGDAIGVDIGGAVADAGDAIVDAGEAVGTWAEGAAETIGDAGEDVIDWLGDAAEDTGDFIMSLF